MPSPGAAQDRSRNHRDEKTSKNYTKIVARREGISSYRQIAQRVDSGRDQQGSENLNELRGSWIRQSVSLSGH